MELYRRVRPTEFGQVVGQDQAVALLKSKLESEESLPHIVLFAGPSGIGKTTLAYIAAKAVGCDMSVANFSEVNAADVRGIDSIREVASVMDMAPMGGKARVWLFDEIVQWPKATQQASLTYLEKCPKHVWMFFCTSDTTGLLPTFLGRCFVINLKALSDDAIKKVLSYALKDEDVSICTPELFHLITTKAEGNARKALQLLEAALSTQDRQEQLDLVGISTIKEEEKVEFLAVALLKRERWATIVKILDGVKTDAEMETLRRQLLAYACKVLVGGGANTRFARGLIEFFRYSWSEVGRAGMYAAAFDCCQRKD